MRATIVNSNVVSGYLSIRADGAEDRPMEFRRQLTEEFAAGDHVTIVKAESGTDEHRYLSTACHHATHEECRQHCKFCGSLCTCGCHRRMP